MRSAGRHCWSALTYTCGALAESKLRQDAARRYGHSYAKRLEVTALTDIVHFLCKQNYDYLRSDNNESREKALRRLVATAGGYMVPVAQAFVPGVKKIIVGKKDVRDELEHILLHIASKFQDLVALEKEDDIYRYLHEKVEFDMRGKVTFSYEKVAIACGEAKSSSNGVGKAKQQIITRAHFLCTAIESMFF
jgi:hypothetical protein